MSDITSQSLLQRVQKQADSRSWAEFMAIYTPLISKWLGQRGVERQDAEDICQDVLRVVVQELPSFDHNGRVGAFRNWLRTITAHRLRTFLRIKDNQPQAGGGSDYLALAAQLEDPHGELTRAWSAEHNRSIVEQLLQMVEMDFSPTTMEAFRRVVLEGQTATAAAEAGGTTVNAVRIAQSRVLARLRHLGAGLID